MKSTTSSPPQESPGNWFHVIFDAELAPAVGLMHSRPEEPWTVASLAEQVNLSRSGRSAFSARFTAAVGRPPLQHLTEYHMPKARSILRKTSLGIKLIAATLGYSNEFAFSNAFKRATGLLPGNYRRSRSTALRRWPMVAWVLSLGMRVVYQGPKRPLVPPARTPRRRTSPRSIAQNSIGSSDASALTC